MFKNFLLILVVISGMPIFAQQKCRQAEYVQQMVNGSPELQYRLSEVEKFTNQKLRSADNFRTARISGIIKIPVIVHVLYHSPEQNIKESAIQQMLLSLNRDFRKKNSDTVNTPSWFKFLAADMEIEFQLASMDPKGKSTNGIVKKYTPVKYWLSDDKMKFTKSSGDDAWDSRNYLNIWICNMQDVLGYASLPGLDSSKDGVVLSIENFINGFNNTLGFNDYRVLVHELGHWLNLYHIWGDSYCGNDFVDDTPKQSSYTPGCPNGIRTSCGSSITGDMYMNFMDFTDDACMNMFTKGQKERARILFEPGGPRQNILYSKGLLNSSLQPAAIPDFYPRWMEARLYPNPATNTITINVEYDDRWIGEELQVIDANGKVMIRKIIQAKKQELDIGRLLPGVYFIKASKEDGKIQSKFVKF